MTTCHNNYNCTWSRHFKLYKYIEEWYMKDLSKFKLCGIYRYFLYITINKNHKTAHYNWYVHISLFLISCFLISHSWFYQYPPSTGGTVVPPYVGMARKQNGGYTKRVLRKGYAVWHNTESIMPHCIALLHTVVACYYSATTVLPHCSSIVVVNNRQLLSPRCSTAMCIVYLGPCICMSWSLTALCTTRVLRTHTRCTVDILLL